MVAAEGEESDVECTRQGWGSVTFQFRMGTVTFCTEKSKPEYVFQLNQFIIALPVDEYTVRQDSRGIVRVPPRQWNS